MSKSKDIQLQTLPVFEYRGQAVADSRDVAALIGRQHFIVMRTIKTMSKHLTDNNFVVSDFFIPATYTDSTGRELPCYYLTQMGCEMIANKQTGAAGTIFTAQYVKAFHAMKEFIMERNSPIWQDTRSLTREVRRIEADAIAELVQYANAQGATAAQWYYATISRLANKTAGITNRDTAHVEQLTALILIERVITEEIRAGISAGKPYKEIYTDLQTRLSGIQALVGHAQAEGEQLTLEAGKDTTGAAKRGRKGNKHE